MPRNANTGEVHESMGHLPPNFLQCLPTSIFFRGEEYVGQSTYECNNWLLTVDSTMDLPRTGTIFVDVFGRFSSLQSV